MSKQKSQDFLGKFKNKKVLIMGLGLHGGGVGAAEFFAKAGAKVIATDLRTKKQLKESIEKLKKWPIKYVLGKHRKEYFKKADLIIRNPAVPDDSPYLKIARKYKIPIDTDIGIFFEACPTTNVIGITGTRGKSTTATLIYEFLKTKYKNVILAGNIRKSALSVIPAKTGISDVDSRLRGNDKKEHKNAKRKRENDKLPLIVLELSSWQLEGLAKHRKSPHIAVMTTIQPDHLNRYKGMKEYVAAKKLIFKNQAKNDFLFLSKNDKIVRNFAKEAKSKVFFYRGDEAKKYKTNLLGKHNLANIAAAAKVAKHFGVGETEIKMVLKKFRGLEGRLQIIAEIVGVKYINDTCATTPDATIAAIKAVTGNQELRIKNLVLIAGGADKNLDFAELAKLIVEKANAVILLEGTATKQLKKAIKKAIRKESREKKNAKKQDYYLPRSYKIINNWNCDFSMIIRRVNAMEEAVKIAYNMAKRGDIVLLSPACASFGMFRHEFDRGEKFTEAVESMKHEVKNF